MAIQVPDVDDFAERAIAAGAKLQRPIADQFYGRRDANLLDPFGYPWSVFTVKEEMSRRGNAPPLPRHDGTGRRREEAGG